MKPPACRLLPAVLLVAACAAVAASASPQEEPSAGPPPFVVDHVQGSVYILVGPDANLAVQVGSDGVLVVDSYKPGMAEQVVAAVRTVSDKPIHYVINTQAGEARTGGNDALKRLGPTRPSRVPLTAGLGGNTGGAVSVLAHENVLNRMSGLSGEPARPTAVWPTDTYFTGAYDMFFNGEAVQVRHVPAAHTDGDSIVFFRRSDVIVAGDVFLTTTYPVIDVRRGGTVGGIIGALNQIIELAVPTHNQEDGTLVVPGAGRISDEMDVVEFRNMVTIVRDRVRDLKDRGWTLDEVLAARPSRDYDPRYGREEGAWTTRMFIEAVYRTLDGPVASEGSSR